MPKESPDDYLKGEIPVTEKSRPAQAADPDGYMRNETPLSSADSPTSQSRGERMRAELGAAIVLAEKVLGTLSPDKNPKESVDAILDALERYEVKEKRGMRLKQPLQGEELAQKFAKDVTEEVSQAIRAQDTRAQMKYLADTGARDRHGRF